MRSFDEYANRYKTVRMERRDGILQATLHTGGGSMVWAEVPHREVGYAFADIGSDPENKVVILTGTGDAFIARGTGPKPAWTMPPSDSDRKWNVHELWDKTYWEGKKLLTNLLDIEVPVIAAINGSARVHSEIPLLCDIVLADDTTVFQDGGHFPRGIPSADGVHIVFPLLMGWNRGRYFLLTGQEIDAQRALELGLVSEVLPPDRLISRAWELAEQLAQQPVLNLRYTRVALTMHLKRLLQDYLGYGLAVEGLAAVQQELGRG